MLNNLYRLLKNRKMKPIDEIKISQLLERTLFAKEMNSLRGGTLCGCSCAYANSGGSSSSANSSANYKIGDGGHSTSGCSQYQTIDNVQWL